MPSIDEQMEQLREDYVQAQTKEEEDRILNKMTTLSILQDAPPST